MIDHAPISPPAPPTPAAARPRIALAHDWLCGYRGGEAVLERIAAIVERRFEPAGVYTMFDDGRPIAPAIDRQRGATTVSPLGRAPGALRVRRWLLPLYPWAIGGLSRALLDAHRRRPIDLVISTSSAAIKGLRPPPGVPHLCVCFAPARYVWSRLDEYAEGGGLRGLGLRSAAPGFRAWDRASAAHVTRFIAISRHVQQEIRRCFGRESQIVHPPVRTEFFTPPPAAPPPDAPWLIVSALEPYKRVDLAIRAANLARRPLSVAGDGSQRRALQRIAGPTVTFTGRVDDDRLRELYRGASAFLFPQVEDFGITALEAQACGVPVAARRSGGALDTVVEGSTGAFFDDPSPESLLGAIAALPRDPAACRRNAEAFGQGAFDRSMEQQVDSLLGG